MKISSTSGFNRRAFLLAAAAASLLPAACASNPGPRAEPARERAPAVKPSERAPALRSSERAPAVKSSHAREVGIASWYGRRYNGRQTASGEIFDMRAATAAHPTLPFGTHVRVTNLENGRSIIVRINDRGPFTRRRVIDVSRHAAEVLGFVHQGIARVEIEIVGRS